MSKTIGYMEDPVVTHLGMIRGQWPIHAFTDEQQAAYWATADRPLHETRVVWPVSSMTLGDAMVGETIPEKRVLKAATR